MTKTICQRSADKKIIVFLCLLCICIFISTVVVSVKLKSSKNFFGKFETNCVRNGSKKMDSFFYRLPRHIVPKNYKLLLWPNMQNKTFRGIVTISINVLKPTKTITLHSHKLNIKSVNLNDKYHNSIDIASTNASNDKRELLNIHIQDKLSKKLYELQIDYSGRLDHGFIAFYASTLKNSKTMVASKFEPTYARQAFPCFDEPEFKATFDITLAKPMSYIALSNMNVISKTRDAESAMELVKFATSVPMSTYLACFVVCDFDYKETEINSNGIGDNFKLRSFAQKDQMHKIDFAQYIGKKATEFYIQYYEVPFPLPKLDMIAIPDYVSGATEHWGLITYRETSFLVDDSSASSKNKINVANTIAHELAHMWFGNLVTMKWWDDLWLNEGFATYMQVKALNAIEPSWTMLDQFLTRVLHSVLVTDAKLSSHPIVQIVDTPDQITSIFDAISYNKGSSVLRMLEGFIGEENFRRGVSDYLKKHKFGNTVTQDLLSSLEPYFKKDNPDLNISYIMDTWTRQMGYPVLNVKKSDVPHTYVITQSRFLLDPDAVYKNDSEFKYRWFIPITYKTNKDQSKSILWFPDTVDSVSLKLRSDDDWIKLNNNQMGYYRVNYEIEMWQELIKQLQNKSKQLTISDRAHLLNDVFALAEAGLLPYDLALNVTTYLTLEEDLVPWEAASAIFTTLGVRLHNSMAYDSLLKYVQELISPLYVQQNWEKTKIDVTKGLLRSRILTMAAWCRLPDAEVKTKELFLNWLNNHDGPSTVEIEPDLRESVYFYGMKSATQAEWDQLWQIYLKEDDAQEKAKLRLALAAPQNTDILRRYLLLSWDEKNIRSQDFLNVLGHISSNPSGTALVWDEVRSQWPRLVDRFTLNSRYLGNLIPGITKTFNTDIKLKEMEQFFAQYPEAGAGELARDRALETVRNNIKWSSSHLDTISKWLKSR